jgi:hypothetical protein
MFTGPTSAGREIVRRRTIFFSSFFCAGLLAIAWQEYFPRAELLQVVGLRGPRASSGRHCDGIYSHRSYWRLPLRAVMCRGPDYAVHGSIYHEMIGVDALTRRIFSASKGWVAPDSLTWVRARDSVSRAMIAAGGQQIRCKYMPDIAPPSSISYWKVHGYYIRVSAFGSNYSSITNWQIQVDGRSQFPDECLHPPRDTSSDTCSGEVVRIPLPRGWVMCWKMPLWS